MSTVRLWGSWIAWIAMAALLLAACGGGTGDPPWTQVPGTQGPAPTATTDPNIPEREMTELRVAYINLLSPVTTDTANPVAAQTFEQRIQVVLEELKVFKPDIIAFSEVFWTKESGSAKSLLFNGLKMDYQYARTNPWTVGQTEEQADQTARLYGFEEGEMVLVRAPLTILGATRHAINPRNSENEGRIVLHIQVAGPERVGNVDVYVTHLTSENERVREQQAADVLKFVQGTRGLGPSLVIGDFSSEPGTPTIAGFTAAGFVDVAAESGAAGITTCCRATVLGAQPPLEGRTDYILSDRLPVAEVGVFAEDPVTRADGAVIYASDHNGITAIFPIRPHPGDP